MLTNSGEQDNDLESSFAHCRSVESNPVRGRPSEYYARAAVLWCPVHVGSSQPNTQLTGVCVGWFGDRPFPVYKQWADRVLEEFYLQGS